MHTLPEQLQDKSLEGLQEYYKWDFWEKYVLKLLCGYFEKLQQKSAIGIPRGTLIEILEELQVLLDEKSLEQL